MNDTPIDPDRLLQTTFVAAVEHYGELDSTNTHARRLLDQTHASLPLLVVADRQTAGRGRNANRWWTGPGSLAMSLAIDRPPGSRDNGPLVALGAALAVIHAVERSASSDIANHRLGLKWPNDVHVDCRKLAGILTESTAEGRLIIGVGVNLNNTVADAPPEFAHQVVTLADVTCRSHDRTHFISNLLLDLQRRMEQLRSTPASIAAAAEPWCLHLGDQVELNQGGRTVRGICRSIAADGALILETDSGRRHFWSGTLRLA